MQGNLHFFVDSGGCFWTKGDPGVAITVLHSRFFPPAARFINSSSALHCKNRFRFYEKCKYKSDPSLISPSMCIASPDLSGEMLFTMFTRAERSTTLEKVS